MRGKILSIGYKASLLRVRNTIIQNAGYAVTTTKETDVVLDLVRKTDFDAVVLCCSIGIRVRQQIARDLKRIKPALPLVIICEREELEFLKPFAEVVIVPPGSSQQPLLKAIAKAIDNTEVEPRPAT